MSFAGSPTSPDRRKAPSFHCSNNRGRRSFPSTAWLGRPRRGRAGRGAAWHGKAWGDARI